MNPVIREATKEDVPKILPVWREMMDFHTQRDPHFTLCHDAEKAFTVYMFENIEKEDAYLFVAENANMVISYCLCTTEIRDLRCVNLIQNMEGFQNLLFLPIIADGVSVSKWLSRLWSGFA